MKTATFRLHTASLLQAMRSTGHAWSYKAWCSAVISCFSTALIGVFRPLLIRASCFIKSRMTSRPHCLRKTSSMQSKRHDLHHTWLHRETNEKLSFYCYSPRWITTTFRTKNKWIWQRPWRQRGKKDQPQIQIQIFIEAPWMGFWNSLQSRRLIGRGNVTFSRSFIRLACRHGGFGVLNPPSGFWSRGEGGYKSRGLQIR